MWAVGIVRAVKAESEASRYISITRGGEGGAGAENIESVDIARRCLLREGPTEIADVAKSLSSLTRGG